MTKERAELLAKFDPDYRARKLHGRWVVWCDVSDHIVEFDFATEMKIVGAGLQV